MSASRPSALGMTVLVGGVLLFLVLVSLAFFLPVLRCPECFGHGSKSLILFTNRQGEQDTRPGEPCGPCSGSGRISHFKQWTHERRAPGR